MPKIYRRECDYCHKKYKGIGAKYCSKRCSELNISKENHPNWKGGRQIDKDGYILVMDKKHPQARNGYVREHRVLIEKKIGRLLKKDEVVHHINENKQDNRIENLELMTTSKHTSLHFTKYSNDDFKKKLNDLYKKLGRVPTSRDCNNSIFIHRFGTFNKALEFAGLKPNRIVKK